MFLKAFHPAPPGFFFFWFLELFESMSANIFQVGTKAETAGQKHSACFHGHPCTLLQKAAWAASSWKPNHLLRSIFHLFYLLAHVYIWWRGKLKKKSWEGQSIVLPLEPVYLPFLSLFILWIIWHAARSALTFSLLLTSLPHLKAMILQYKKQTLGCLIPDQNANDSKLWSSLTSCCWIEAAQNFFPAELHSGRLHGSPVLCPYQHLIKPQPLTAVDRDCHSHDCGWFLSELNLVKMGTTHCATGLHGKPQRNCDLHSPFEWFQIA